jgi:hypothetical protein
VSADGLQSALAALDSYWSGRDPTWSKRLPPGLTQREIQDAEAAIHPMVLSDELRILYGWHDGDGQGLAFGDEWPYFLPLSAAIEWWRFGHEELGWTPCWFPLKSFDKQYWIALIDSVRQENSGILNFWVDENPQPYLPSTEAMVRWHLDCFTDGIVGSRFDDSHEMRFDAVENIRRRHTGPILVRGEPLADEISSVFTIDWPSAWKEAAGIDEAQEIPVGATTTIRELLSREVSGGIIRGRVTWYGGARNWGIVQIDDGTGRTLVAYAEGTPGGRNLGMGVQSELTVKPRVGPLADYLEHTERLMGYVQFVAESIRVVRDA